MPTLANIIKNIDPPIELTATEYNALTTQQKNDGTVYYVTDGDESVIYKSGVAYGIPASDLPFELGIENGVYGYYTTGGTFVGFKNPTGNATAADVLSGKTFANATSDSLTGSMTNRGAVSKTLDCGNSYTVPKGYHNGSGTVTANSLASQTGVDDGKTAATASTIRSGYQAWVNGNKISGSMATLTSANFSGTHSSTVAGAASNYVTKSTSAGYVANSTSVNTLAAGTSPTISTTAATGTKTINVKPGYYNKISVNQTSAYNAGAKSGKLLYAYRTRVDNASVNYMDSSATATVAQTVTIKYNIKNMTTPCQAKVSYLIGTTEHSISAPSTAGETSSSTTVSLSANEKLTLRAYGGATTGGAVCHSSLSAIVY